MSDVILDDGSEQVTVQCNNLHVQGHDFLLDAPERRKPNSPAFRRALVHDHNDGLTMNFAGDYPGGISLTGVVGVASLLPLRQPGDLPEGVPTLVVHGGISYETAGVTEKGAPSRITVFLADELANLQKQISALAARVKALEAKP